MLRLFQYISPIKFYTNQNHLINVKQNFHFPIFARVLLFTVVISLFSCEKDELDFSTPDMEQAKMSNSSTDFRRKIENPYTVQNMQMALDSVIHRMERGKLKSASDEKNSIPKKEKIEPNVLYIQFIPKTWCNKMSTKSPYSFKEVRYKLDLLLSKSSSSCGKYISANTLYFTPSGNSRSTETVV